jgi:hypothetical protein
MMKIEMIRCQFTVLVIFFVFANTSFAELYSWVDESGITNYTSDKNSIPTYIATGDNPAQISDSVKNSAISLNLSKKTIYLIDGTDSIDLIEDSASYSYVKYLGARPEESIFFQIDGKAVPVLFSSSDISVAKVDNKGFVTPTNNAGTAKITAKLGGETTTETITVIKIPVKKGMTSEQVISTLGLPDEKFEGSVSWYDTKRIHDHLYSGKGGVSVIYKHWIYKSYPGAIFRFDSQNYFRLSGCISLDQRMTR